MVLFWIQKVQLNTDNLATLAFAPAAVRVVSSSELEHFAYISARFGKLLRAQNLSRSSDERSNISLRRNGAGATEIIPSEKIAALIAMLKTKFCRNILLNEKSCDTLVFRSFVNRRVTTITHRHPFEPPGH